MPPQTLSDADRRLRIIQFWCFIPALALGIPAAVSNRSPIFAMGIIPMGLSAIHALFVMYSKSRNRSVRIAGVNIWLDFHLALAVLALFLLHTIVTSTMWRWSNKQLNDFASMPLLVNFCIHAFFALTELPFEPLFKLWFSPSTCPHCQHTIPNKRDPRLLWDLTPGGSGSNTSVHSHDTAKQGYIHLPAAESGEYTEGDKVQEVTERSVEVDNEGTPRASIDDESARLL